MKAEKIRNLTDEELRSRRASSTDQLFKLKFQLNMGQTESLKKIRGLRKDIARVKTIARERERWPQRRRRVMAKRNRNRAGAGPAQGNGGRSGFRPMHKTIVVEVMRKKSHPFYFRVVAKTRSSMLMTRRMKRTWAMWCGSKRRDRCRS